MADILLGALIILLLLLALNSMAKHKNSGCNGSCSSCQMNGSCDSFTKNNNEKNSK